MTVQMTPKMLADMGCQLLFSFFDPAKEIDERLKEMIGQEVVFWDPFYLFPLNKKAVTRKYKKHYYVKSAERIHDSISLQIEEHPHGTV